MKRVIFSLILCLIVISSAFSMSFKASDEVHPFDSIPMLETYYDETNDSNMDFWDGCTVSLLTIGPGGPLYSWFGHSAFLVEAPNGRNYVFDYGTFSFSEDNFIINFVMGRLWFMCFGSNADYELSNIQEEGRSVSKVVLPLDANQKKAVVGFLNANIKPENRTYLYHHYNDNCATRVRDIIDWTTGGEFQQWAKSRYGYTFRQQASRALSQNRIVLWGLDFLQSGNIDKGATLWDEMFLPEMLEKAVTEYYGLESEIIVEGSGEYREMADAPQGNFLFSLILGLVLGGVSTVLIWFGKDRANLIYTAVVDIVFGLLGSVLLFMMVFTNHDVTWFNENILFVNPYLIVLAIISLLALKRNGRSFRRVKAVKVSYMILFNIIAVLAMTKCILIDLLYQQNWTVILTMALYYLPNWLRISKRK